MVNVSKWVRSLFWTKTLFFTKVIHFKKSTIKSALSKNIVIYLILIITNKKKLEFAYYYISCRKFITAKTTANTLSEIVADLVDRSFVGFVDRSFVGFVGHPFVDLVDHPFAGSLDQPVFGPVQ